MEIAIPVIGGLGLLLYGMNLMGEALQKAVGNKMRNVIGSLTKNKYIGALLGFVVTMVVGSSSATTVMTIGFVNAGIMTLDQAVGIIIGSNLGTTVTTQLIAFNLDSIAPVVVGISVAIIFLSSNKKKMRAVGEIGFGFGLIFMGMGLMKSGLGPLQHMPWFSDLLLKLNNPIFGVFVGLVLTTLVQSSAASIGLMQALASQGLLTMNQAFPILFGDNIGTTTTGLMACIGTNRNGKRTAMSHFLFNVVGTIIFMVFLRIPIQKAVIYLSPMSVERQIANAHTLFNLINIIIQLPFSNYLVKAACYLVPDVEEEKETYSAYLDDLVLRTPAIAIGAARKEVIRMGDITAENIQKAKNSILEYNENQVEQILENEKIINELEREIVEYLVKISKTNISQEQHEQVYTMMSMANDIERVGDHVKNIMELSAFLNEGHLYFTEDAKREFINISDEASKAFQNAIKSLIRGDINWRMLPNEVRTPLISWKKYQRY